MNSAAEISRRSFLASSVAALVGCGAAPRSAAQPSAGRKAIVGAHPWVYAATQPKYDITPVMPQIFADMSYAGFDGIELMHTALLPDAAVAREPEDEPGVCAESARLLTVAVWRRSDFGLRL